MPHRDVKNGSAAPQTQASSVRRFLAFWINRANGAMNAQAIDLLEKTAGLSLSQWRVLAMVGGGGADTSRAVAADAHLDPAVVSRSIRKLEGDGLLVSDRLEEDRRTLSLKLTDLGWSVFQKTLPVMQARHDALIDALDEAECAVIMSALEKLAAAAERRDFAP